VYFRSGPAFIDYLHEVKVSNFVASIFRGPVQFEITDWQAGRRWSWRVAGLPATGHVVAAVGPSRCRVTFTVPAWAPFYVPVCRAALRRLRDLALAEAD
jgi:hypothetical protein